MITATSTTTQAFLVIFFVLIASALVASSNGSERGDQHLRAEHHHAAITPATPNRAGRPRLLRADGQRNLFAESVPDIDPRTGRPRLLRTNGQRHLLLARDSMHELTTTRRRLQEQGEEEKSTLDSLKDTYDEVMAIDETPPEEWTSAQKWGVAIGVLAAFVIVSCIWRCLCCK